ncbi:hypothetical protein HAX54_049388 [Datura stramonium]|uniref:J domain-containing protein n=1 Tax=Datura stramonium TaxID=4076 RepID=A0ABS8SUT7_DATST|nr:hypothetical protein [Datura stramonium]
MKNEMEFKGRENHHHLEKGRTTLVAGLASCCRMLQGGGVQAWQAFKARPPTARMRKFYEGGFQPKMNRREAALILGVRAAFSANFDQANFLCLNRTVKLKRASLQQGKHSLDKVREAHRKVMVANHPDAGGSHYLASKINGRRHIAWTDEEQWIRILATEMQLDTRKDVRDYEITEVAVYITGPCVNAECFVLKQCPY